MDKTIILEFFAYFFAGLLQDFLATLNVRYITKNNIVLAMLSSFLITVIYLAIIYNILTSMDSERSIFAIVFYAAGISAGTLCGMKFRLGFKKHR